MTLDLVRLGQRAAYDTAVLVSGDRDLAEAVRSAQDAGRRVVLAFPQGAGVAGELRELADDIVTIERGTIEEWFEVREARGEEPDEEADDALIEALHPEAQEPPREG